MKTFYIWITIVIVVAACSASSGLSADAGADFSAMIGAAPSFDACGSTGQIVNYKWTIISAPEAMAKDVGKVIREIEPNCSFTLEAAMGLDEVGQWIIQLEVRDANGNTANDTLAVTVSQS